MRANKRPNNSIRPVRIITDTMEYAEGSALIELGKTRVIATATIEDKVPHFLKGSGSGWITAEYSLLPRSTDRRTPRERTPIRISGRTQEIQRLIGRSLRAVSDLQAFGERTIIVDCDVIQADGGTRSAAITAGCVALGLAFKKLMDSGIIDRMPLKHLAGAVSAGIVNGKSLLDLDYSEDSQADIDMNVVKTDTGQIIEIQASAEKNTFSQEQFMQLLKLADEGIEDLIAVQKEALKAKSLMFMAYQQPGKGRIPLSKQKGDSA